MIDAREETRLSDCWWFNIFIYIPKYATTDINICLRKPPRLFFNYPLRYEEPHANACADVRNIFDAFVFLSWNVACANLTWSLALHTAVHSAPRELVRWQICACLRVCIVCGG